MPADLLYEIGVEEIPAGFVLPALEQLEKALREGLERLRLTHGPLTTFGTPRRLAVLVTDLADRQPDAENELKGPPADRAFDADGKPTQAAVGFARKAGVDVTELRLQDTDKGKWVVVTVREPGRPAAEVLPALLSEATLALNFPKSMRWAELDLRFARPIRWLVALLGDQVLEVTVAEVTAGNATRGHRVLGSHHIPLAAPADYREALRANFVLADIAERREAIRASATAAAAEVGGRARIDEDLLTEVSFLVEWPTCLWGGFDAKYLALPEPVIVTVMQGHQRYFPVEEPAKMGTGSCAENGDWQSGFRPLENRCLSPFSASPGTLMPYFIAVRNGTDEGLETVRAGNQRVIGPRLADAEFYLTEDLKHTLDERAAHLAKADLVTLMVGDSKLGELQGIIGGEYARRLGETEDVAAAISEQYRPRGATDAVPATAAGTLLSIADKLDNLAACFRLGAVPSGSTDPFALRRQAQGVVEMLLTRGLHINLREAVELALSLLPEPKLEKQRDAAKVLPPEAAAQALMAFLAQRVDAVLLRDGVAYDVSRAVLGTPWEDALEVIERGRFLQALRADDPALFDTLVTAAERPARIARPADIPPDAAPDPSLFAEDWERKLLAVSTDAGAHVAAAFAASPRDYAAAGQALAALAEPIHEFFAAVMVMVDDESLRTNRLALLGGIDRTFIQLADFLEIVREGG